MAVPKEVSEYMSRKGAIGGKLRWQNVNPEKKAEIMRKVRAGKRKKKLSTPSA
jgi:hypothetical protein